MRQVLSIFAAMLTCAAIGSPSDALAATWRVVGIPSYDTLNVRKSPSTQSERLADLEPNATGLTLIECANGVDVSALGRLRDDAVKSALSNTWCRIQYGASMGWVSANYLLPDRQSASQKDATNNLGAAWLVVFSFQNKDEAIAKAKLFSAEFPFTAVFSSKTGFFAVVLGAGAPEVIKGVRRELLEKGIIPQDSYVSTGSNFVELAWPSQSVNPVAQPPSLDHLIRTGSGVILARKGIVISNNHVTEECGQIFLRRADEVPVSAEVLASATTPDLSVLQAAGEFQISAPLRVRPEPRLGEPVYVYGFPLFGTLAASGNFTSGLLSAKNGVRNDPMYYQTSAPVQSGNSGGPLLDGSGSVIGIVSAKMNGQVESGSSIVDVPQNVNFALKSSVVSDFLERNKVSIDKAPSGHMMDVPEIADAAVSFTVQIECYE